MAQTTQAELQDKIVAKAQAEPEFRAQLVADPKAAIEGVVGSELPEAINIEVHEDSAYVVSPRAAAEPRVDRRGTSYRVRRRSHLVW